MYVCVCMHVCVRVCVCVCVCVCVTEEAGTWHPQVYAGGVLGNGPEYLSASFPVMMVGTSLASSSSTLVRSMYLRARSAAPGTSTESNPYRHHQDKTRKGT